MRGKSVGAIRTNVLAFLAVMAFGQTAAGQQQPPHRWTPSLSGGVARAGLRGGGSTGAARVGFELQRSINSRVGTVFSVDSYVMQEGMAEPSCIAGAQCQETSTLPGMLVGSSMGLVFHPVGDALSLLTSVGGFYGPSIVGSQPKSAVSTTLGADIELPWQSRFAPIIGIRLVYLSQPLANVRTLMGPGAGLGF
ncbi:MAG: hypothetical protein U0132_05810 [Gemmatimonadaceae bacterium]